MPSGPWIASKTIAQSSAVRQIGPSLSVVHDSAMAPVRGTRPKLGRNPDTPQVRDGDVIEPFVSEPMLKPTQPAAVADAGPADEPLEPVSGFHGLRVRSFHQRSPCASDPSVSFATRIAPASSRRFTTVAS